MPSAQSCYRLYWATSRWRLYNPALLHVLIGFLCLSVLPIRWSDFLTAASAVQVVEVDWVQLYGEVFGPYSKSRQYYISSSWSSMIPVCRRAAPPERVYPRKFLRSPWEPGSAVRLVICYVPVSRLWSGGYVVVDFHHPGLFLLRPV